MTTGGRRRTGSRTSARSTGSRASATGRTSGARTGSGYRTTARRRPRGLPSTVGAALGTLIVTTLLDLSWPARLGLLALIVVVGLGYILWRNRREILAGSAGASDAEPAPTTPTPATAPAPNAPTDPTAPTAPTAPTEGAS